MGISGGGGGGGSASQGYQYTNNLLQSLSGQNIWGPQAQQLQGMYTGAGQLAGQQAGMMQGAAQGQLNQVMPAAQAGLSAMQQYATPNNALAAQQLGDMSQQIGQNFNREILPGIRSGAGQGVGGMGGSREALARGVAAGDAANAIGTAGSTLYGQQYALGQNAAAQLPGMAGNVYNLGMQPYQAAWAPYQALQAILGGPTALSYGAQQSIQRGENWNTAQGKPTNPSYGFNLW